MDQDLAGEVELLESNGAIISAFLYYFSWFSLQSLVDMKMGVPSALASGTAMGICMTVTLGGVFAKGRWHGIVLRVIFGACSMGIGPLAEYMLKKAIARGDNIISRWNHIVTVNYLDFIIHNSFSGIIVIATWILTAMFISTLTGY